MINEALRQWEKEYGDVRHKENSEKFEQLFALLNRAKGAVWTVGILLSGLLTGFKIYELTHR